MATVGRINSCVKGKNFRQNQVRELQLSAVTDWELRGEIRIKGRWDKATTYTIYQIQCLCSQRFEFLN